MEGIYVPPTVVAYITATERLFVPDKVVRALSHVDPSRGGLA